MDTPSEIDAPTRTKRLRACPVCSSTRTRPKFAAYDALHGVPGLFHYEQCAACGSVFQSPRVVPEDLARCYPTDYFTHAPLPTQPSDPPTTSTWMGSFRPRFRDAVLGHADGTAPRQLTLRQLTLRQLTLRHLLLRQLGALGARVPSVRRRARYGLIDNLAFTGRSGDRCLEVGFGRGAELRNLARLGWVAHGIDPDRTAVETARGHQGIDVQVGTLLDNGYPDGHFALVYMHHSLEHIAELREGLLAARRLLRPGGRLVAIYPNPHSLGTRLYRTASPNWDPPRHLVLPSRVAIRRLLREVGFDRLRVSTRALRAESYSAIAHHYRRYPCGGAGLPDGPPTSEDRWFARLEKALVTLGFQLGEEIVVDAWS